VTVLWLFALTCHAPSLSTPSQFASQVGEALLGSVSAEIKASQGPRAEQMLPLANLMEPWAPHTPRSSVHIKGPDDVNVISGSTDDLDPWGATHLDHQCTLRALMMSM